MSKIITHGQSKYLPILLYGTESCPVNSAMRHSLQFDLNRALFKIFGALFKDSYQDICKYFGIWTAKEQISAGKSKSNKRYRSSDRAVCYAISIEEVVKYDIMQLKIILLCSFIANTVTCFYVMLYMLSIFI